MRGRKPKPIERQIAEGDPRKRGKKKLEERRAVGVKTASGFPPCPKHLTGRARSTFLFWQAELRAMDLEKRPDAPMLEGAARAYERAVAADIILQRDGLLVERKIVDEDGDVIVFEIKKHPAVEISNRSWLIVKAFCSEFGLSPVSRTRLAIEKKPEDPTDLLAMLSEPRRRTSAHKELVQ